MSIAFAVDPVAGAALAAGATQWVGLDLGTMIDIEPGDIVCPTCRGRTIVMRPDLHNTMGNCLRCYPNRGHIAAPSDKILIGTTTFEPAEQIGGRGNDVYKLDRQWVMHDGTMLYDVHVGRLFGVADSVDVVPIIDSQDDANEAAARLGNDTQRPVIVHDRGKWVAWEYDGFPTGEWDERDITASTRYGTWSPHQYAIRINGYQPLPIFGPLDWADAPDVPGFVEYETLRQNGPT